MNGTTDSRDTILGRIREALRLPAALPHLADQSIERHVASSVSHARPETRSLPVLPLDAARPWLPDGGSTPDERLRILMDNLALLRAVVHRCGSLEEARGTIARLVVEHRWQRIAWHDHALIRPLIDGLPCDTARVDAPGGCDKDVLEGCDAGITACESIVAQTGSILVGSGSCGGRALSILPHEHIVVATLDQIVSTLGDALHETKRRHAGRIPSMLSFITGPSRTGDIERILVLGAHGPKWLHVILVG